MNNPESLRKALSRNVPLKTGLQVMVLLFLLASATALLLVHLFFPGVFTGSGQSDIRMITAQNNLAENPNDVDALIRLGYANLTLQNYRKALSLYKKAYAMAPQSPLVQYHLALGYLALENHKEAIRLLEPLAAEGLFNAETHYTLGRAYYLSGRYEEAAESLKKTVSLVPAADAYYLLGLCYTELGEEDQARQALSKAIAMVPDYSEAQSALSRLSLHLPADGMPAEE